MFENLECKVGVKCNVIALFLLHPVLRRLDNYEVLKLKRTR